jgi:hypothetical protein
MFSALKSQFISTVESTVPLIHCHIMSLLSPVEVNNHRMESGRNLVVKRASADGD